MLNIDEATQTFDSLLGSSTKSLFKAEVLQDYSAVDDGPSLRAWMSGDKDLAKTLAVDNGASWVETCRALSAKITRVHVVEQPLTPYMEWEIECCYKRSIIPAGTEKIFLAPAAEMKLALPDGDFWIFDEATVLQWSYGGPHNAIDGATIFESRSEAAPFIALRDELLRVGVEVFAD